MTFLFIAPVPYLQLVPFLFYPFPPPLIFPPFSFDSSSRSVFRRRAPTLYLCSSLTSNVLLACGLFLSRLSSLHSSLFISTLSLVSSMSLPPLALFLSFSLFLSGSTPPLNNTHQPARPLLQQHTSGTDSMAYHFIDLLSPLSQVSTRIFHHFMQASPSCPFIRATTPYPPSAPDSSLRPSINRTNRNAESRLRPTSQGLWNTSFGSKIDAHVSRVKQIVKDSRMY